MRPLPRISRRHGGQEIPGVLRPIFIYNRSYFLTELKVYADGMIDCWELVTFEHFKRKVADGWVVTALPPGAEVSIHHLARFRAGKVHATIPESELIKEVADIIDDLNGRSTAASRFTEALRRFHASPQRKRDKEPLRAAYEAVPEYERVYLLGDQDVKDIPIRMILYGAGEQKKWTHRRAARAAGIAVPTIDPKQVVAEKVEAPTRPTSQTLTLALRTLYVQVLEDRTAHDSALRELNDDPLPVALKAARVAQKELSRMRGRPRRQTLLSGILSNLGDWLLEKDHERDARRAFEAALNEDRESAAAGGLARIALRHNDQRLARRCLESLRINELGKFVLNDPRLAANLFPGLDIEAVLRLAETTKPKTKR